MTREAKSLEAPPKALDSAKRTAAPEAEAPLHREAVVALSSPPGAPEVKMGKLDAPSLAPAPAKAEAAEKGNLTSEMKAAVDKSEKIVVKMAPAGGDKSDLVIKSDGTIVQNLNMDPNKAASKNLTVSVEQNTGSSEPLTKQQNDALEKVLAYAKEKNKEVTLAEADSSTPPEVKASTAAPIPSAGTPSAGDSGGGGGGGGGGSAPSGDGGGGATDSGGGYSGDGGYSSPGPPDYSKVDLSALVTEWFNDPASLEKFKELYPELYAKLVGADGKLDMNKLKQMKASNDPVLEGLREKLPTIAPEFPNTKALSSVASISGDAVNATGAKLAENAAQVSREMGGTGYCATAVSEAVKRTTGKDVWGNANDLPKDLVKHGFTEVDPKNLKPGQVLVVPWTEEVYAQERLKRGQHVANIGDTVVIGKDSEGKLKAYNDAEYDLKEYLAKGRYNFRELRAFNPPATA
jgi:hypothetical protein